MWGNPTLLHRAKSIEKNIEKRRHNQLRPQVMQYTMTIR